MASMTRMSRWPYPVYSIKARRCFVFLTKDEVGLVAGRGPFVMDDFGDAVRVNRELQSWFYKFKMPGRKRGRPTKWGATK